MANPETQRIALRAAEVERRAEALERWKKEFLANVSHELRTPLNAILGYSRLLLNDHLPDRYHRQIEEINGAGNVLLDLINNIIDFSKLSGGEIRLASAPFHLRDVTAGLIEHYHPAADHKGLRLECHIPSNVPVFLRGDKHRYRQILASLLSNAVKFTQRGEISLRVTLDEVADDHLTIRTVVTDTGVGIAADRSEAVFQEFTQADGSTTRRFGGMGLGLAVAKRLVDLMGGQIGFRSVVGDGTSFWVTLPFGMVTRRDNLPEEQPADQYFVGSDAQVSAGATRRRILAVDGDAHQRVLIEAFLSRIGCLVDAVSSVDDAISAAKGLAYDLAFVEIPEPGRLDGIRRLRAVMQEQGRQTPIIALGHEPGPADRQTIVDAGATSFLPKPFEIPDLIETVQDYLPLAMEPLLAAGASLEQENATYEIDDESSWSDQIDEMKRAFAEADHDCLESRIGAIRRSALKKGSRAVADEAMRLQVAVRSGDGYRMTAALERLHRAATMAHETGAIRRDQFQTC